MFENLYTTKMSSSKKVLQKRFTLIQNNKKIRIMITVLSGLVAVVIFSTTALASGVLSDLTTEDYRVEISNDGEKIELANKSFIENNTVYVPLRELFSIVGAISDNEQSYINWDNGKVDLAVTLNGSALVNDIEDVDVTFLYKYSIEIGKTALVENFEPNVLGRQNNSNTTIMTNAPILKNGVTYIPYSYADYMLNRNDHCNVNYSVYDKNGNVIKISENTLDREATIFTTEGETFFISENLKNPQLTIEGFFQAFAQSDFALMKNHCTEECKKTFFGDGYCFGMTWAELTYISIDTLEYVKSSNDLNVFVTVNMTPHKNSVFDKSQTSTSFYVMLQRQPDGRYLIDEFATGL